MKNLYLILIGLLVISNTLFAQVGINSDNSSPHSSAMLDVKSTNKGFLPPRVELTAINSSDPITLPASGLLVYNTATTGTPPYNVIPGYYYWNGTRWIHIAHPEGTNPGDMLYWDGFQWTVVSSGLPGQFLRLSQTNLPIWSGPTYTSLTTTTISNITTTTSSSGGNITNNGGAEVTIRGVCWSTTPNPVATENYTIDGSGNGLFESNLTGLAENTLYYVRAYATNVVGTSYGNEVTFTTLTLPAVTTAIVTNITQNTAVSVGNVTFDGNSTETVRGVCWSTSTNPTTSGSHTTDGTGAGAFVSNITGLAEGTQYYVRAYATNLAGTVYGTEMSFNTLLSDIDANLYKTVNIGSQVWMAENLKTTKLNNGTAIPLVTDNSAWWGSTSPEYCWYNNDAPTYKDTYGAIYNWYTVNTGNLCPNGWHVPNETEWTALESFLGGVSIAGGKLKETGTTHWLSPNTGATNESGFTALPGGYRTYGFTGINNQGVWWSSTVLPVGYAYCHSISYSGPSIDNGYNTQNYGFSVRCLKD